MTSTTASGNVHSTPLKEMDLEALCLKNDQQIQNSADISLLNSNVIFSFLMILISMHDIACPY